MDLQRAVLAFLFAVAVPLATAGAQTSETSADDAFGLEVHSFSGSPLLLQIDLDLPEGLFTRVEVSTRDSQHFFQLPPGSLPQSTRTITLAPFAEAGVYDLLVRLTGRGRSVEIPYRIGFTDFVWGRDNLRFGNNGDFETYGGDYSLALSSWLEERFGEVSAAERVLLVHYMYSLFGRNPGRCYAFSGTEYRYITQPELLPSYYDNAYEVRGSAERIKREMHFLQMDIVFDLFVRGGIPRHGAQDVESAREQVGTIVRRIESGTPVVAGFIGPELHHSMLVYGFIDRLGSDSIDLIVANNWKDKQDINIHSRDAEYVRVSMDASPGTPLLDWRYDGGRRPRQPNRFFVVDVAEEYDLDRVLLEDYLSSLRGRLQDRGLAILVVENAASAWLTNAAGEVSGRERWRNREQIDGVTFERRKRTYSFEIQETEGLSLHFEDNDGTRLFFLDGDEAWISVTEAPEEETERLVRLGGAPLVIEEPLSDEPQS